MRLPNGFGQISEIKNKNLRNRFRVMVTVGKTETGKPIAKLLKPVSYFPTYNEAYAALIEYNKNPYDLDKTITMKELYLQHTRKRITAMAYKKLYRKRDKSCKRCKKINNPFNAKKFKIGI